MNSNNQSSTNPPKVQQPVTPAVSTTSPEILDTSSTHRRRSVYVVLILLIILIITSFVVGILDNRFLVEGLLVGIIGTITGLFGAFAHIGFLESFDEFINKPSKKQTQPKRWLHPKVKQYLIRGSLIILSSGIVFTGTLYISPINSRICQRTFISWNLICGNAYGTIKGDYPDTLGKSPLLKIGIIDNIGDAPFNLGDHPEAELQVERKIFSQNQQIAQNSNPYLTLAVMTMLSTTSDDPSISANVGLEDLKGAYLFQEYYNSPQQKHTVKLRLVIANVGTSLTTNSTVPIIMGRIALLMHQDTTFRGILGLPFSSTTEIALGSRDDLSINQIPIISPSTTSDKLAGYAHFYRIPSPDKTQSCVSLDFMANDLIPSLGFSSNQQFNISVFQNSDANDSYSGDLASDFGEAKTGNLSCTSYSSSPHTSKLHVFPESYVRGSQDFKASIDDAIHQRVDLIFFSGYTSDLNNFEASLSQEQTALRYQKRIFIVGGDGLYQTDGKDNTYTTVYTTIYIPPLSVNENVSEAEKLFVEHYRKEFELTNTNTIPTGIMFPPHAIEMYDATNAFMAAIAPNTNAIPTQDDFDWSLGKVSFVGLTGLVQFDVRQNNPLKGISAPLYKTIYVMCTNKYHQTAEAAVYSPGPTPAIMFNLKGQNLLDCNPS